MNQQDFDTQMSRIMTGTEMAISFKTLGLSREDQINFNVNLNRIFHIRFNKT